MDRTVEKPYHGLVLGKPRAHVSVRVVGALQDTLVLGHAGQQLCGGDRRGLSLPAVRAMLGAGFLIVSRLGAEQRFGFVEQRHVVCPQFPDVLDRGQQRVHATLLPDFLGMGYDAGRQAERLLQRLEGSWQVQSLQEAVHQRFSLSLNYAIVRVDLVYSWSFAVRVSSSSIMVLLTSLSRRSA